MFVRSLIKSLLFTMALLSAAATQSQAEELLGFGTDKGKIDKAEISAGATGKVTFAADYLKLVGPNFWSNRWQLNQIGVDLTDAKDTDYLTLEVSGETKDEAPILKVLLISPDWSAKSIYTFDLSQLSKDEFKVIRATTPLGQPSEKDGEGVSTAALIGNVMFITGAKGGANPWLLKIKSLSVAKPAAPAAAPAK